MDDDIYLGTSRLKIVYNSFTQTVYHFIQKYGTVLIPFCGNFGELVITKRGEDLFERVKRGDKILFDSRTDILCKKCSDSVLRPGKSDDEKYFDRIFKYRERQSRIIKRQVKNDNLKSLETLIRKTFFSNCLTCQFILATRKFSIGDLESCDRCFTQWRIEVNCYASGLFEFTIRKYPETNLYKRGIGHILWKTPFIKYE